MNGPATILIFDGDCGFCTRCVLWGTVKLATFPHTIAYQSIHPEDFGLTDQDVRKSVWLISGSTILSGARAVAEILRRQPSTFWRALGAFLDWCPMRPIAALGYRLIAINRHRLPGASTECKMVNLD